MAASPGLKIYNQQGEYIAACFHIEDAACLAAFNGAGSTIRNGHAKRDTVWTEGTDKDHQGSAHDKEEEPELFDPRAFVDEHVSDTRSGP